MKQGASARVLTVPDLNMDVAHSLAKKPFGRTDPS